MQHQSLEFRHFFVSDFIGGLEMRQIAQHPTQRVAQLAIGLDGGFEDFRADALVVPVVGGAGPQPQDIGARLFDHVLGRDHIAKRLRHFVAVLVEDEAVSHDDIERRAATSAAAFKERGLKPAAVLVGAFEIHHEVGAASIRAPDSGETGEMLGVFEHEGMSRAGIEPDVEDVVHFLPAVFAVRSEKPFARAVGIPGIRTLLLERFDDAEIHLRIVEDFDRAVRLFLDEYRDRHAPGALARDHPIGPALDHAGDAILALRRHPARRLDRGERATAQGVVATIDILVHRNEPLRRVAKDHRLLRTP